jgi:Arc/MetJ-type ribon-helix-helix transcriptional regulator
MNSRLLVLLMLVSMLASSTMPVHLAKWVDEQVEAREYVTQNHALEVALLELKKNKSKLKSSEWRK